MIIRVKLVYEISGFTHKSSGGSMILSIESRKYEPIKVKILQLFNHAIGKKSWTCILCKQKYSSYSISCKKCTFCAQNMHRQWNFNFINYKGEKYDMSLVFLSGSAPTSGWIFTIVVRTYRIEEKPFSYLYLAKFFPISYWLLVEPSGAC